METKETIRKQQGFLFPIPKGKETETQKCTIMNHYISTKSLIEEIKELMGRHHQPIRSKKIDFDEPRSLNDLTKLCEELKTHMNHTDWIAMRDEGYWKRRKRIYDDTDSLDHIIKQLIFLIAEMTNYLQNKHHDKGSL